MEEGGGEGRDTESGGEVYGGEYSLHALSTAERLCELLLALREKKEGEKKFPRNSIHVRTSRLFDRRPKKSHTHSRSPKVLARNFLEKNKTLVGKKILEICCQGSFKVGSLKISLLSLVKARLFLKIRRLVLVTHLSLLEGFVSTVGCQQNTHAHVSHNKSFPSSFSSSLLHWRENEAPSSLSFSTIFPSSSFSTPPPPPPRNGRKC